LSGTKKDTQNSTSPRINSRNHNLKTQRATFSFGACTPDFRDLKDFRPDFRDFRDFKDFRELKYSNGFGPDFKEFRSGVGALSEIQCQVLWISGRF